jgi:hypothetical protein
MTGSVVDIEKGTLIGYIVGPLVAFDSVVQSPAGFVMATSHVFQFPLSLAANLHLITNYTKPPQFDSFIFIPFQMNVYTVFKFYFVELGTAVTMVLMAFFGLINSLFYLKAREGGRFSTYLFAYSMFTVLLMLRAIALGLLYFLIGSVPLRLLPAIKVRRQSKNTRLESSNV